VSQIILKRSQLEKWSDEPFFDKTVTNCLVKINFRNWWLIAEIKEVVTDESRAYKLKNDKISTKFLILLLGEDKEGKYKEFDITRISNTPMTEQDFANHLKARQHYNVPFVNLRDVYRKKRHLKKAENYEYKPLEIEEMAMNKFDRALSKNLLADFPNVPYFQ